MTKRIGTSYARQFQRPDDAARERENADQRERLESYALDVRKQAEEERSLTRPFDEAFQERTAGHSMTEEATVADPINSMIMASAEKAAERVVIRSRTSAQQIGDAVADALIERGIVDDPTEYETTSAYEEFQAGQEDGYETGWMDEETGHEFVKDSEGDTVMSSAYVEGEDDEELREQYEHEEDNRAA